MEVGRHFSISQTWPSEYERDWSVHPSVLTRERLSHRPTRFQILLIGKIFVMTSAGGTGPADSATAGPIFLAFLTESRKVTSVYKDDIDLSELLNLHVDL